MTHQTVEQNNMTVSADNKSLISSIEQMLKESVLCWGDWDKLEVEKLEDCTITHSPVSFPFFNNVMEPAFSQDTARQRIDEVLNLVGKKEQPVCWWLGQSNQPANLAELLEEVGAFKAMENMLMAAELKDLPEVVLPTGLEIVEVTSREQLADWTSVVAPAHNIPTEMTQHWTDMYAAAGFGPESSVTRHFIAYLNGQLVGATSLITAAGVASVANVATDINFRGQGVGSALTLWPLHIAKQAGYMIAGLSASKDGEPVYAKLGFQRLVKNAVYLWMPPQEA